MIVKIVKDEEKYSHYKKEALSLYEEYKKALGEEVDSKIEEEAKAIEEEIFNIMVLGEAKSGKSTFINAYLRKEILPMDELQCTSAIIEIKHGEEIKLIATTADGNKKEENGLEEVSKFLKEEAAIDDNYREIPTTTINNELIRKKGRIDDEDIKEFLEAVKKYKLAPEKYNNLIRNYIKEKKDKWGEIITKINITYPLSEMKDYTLVDSPGVGAVGDLGETTGNYIEKANAIIFVKSLQTFELKSFFEYLQTIISKRSKDFLFLVFTRISDENPRGLERRKEKAIERFGEYINKDKILFVDSKIQLFLNKAVKLGTVEEIDKFFDELDEKGENFDAAETCWNRAKGNFDIFKENMEKKSNFDKVFEAIRKFALKANFQRLKEFLEVIQKTYVSKKAILSDQIELLQKDFKSPEEFEKEIDKITEEIDKIFVKVNEGVYAIKKDYLNKLNIEAEEIEEDFKKKLKEFETEIKDETFDLIKKETMDAFDKVKELQDEIAKGVIEECDKELLKCSNEINLSFANMVSPVFTKEEFESIKKEAEVDPEVKGENRETYIIFEKKVPFYHRNKHVKIVVNSIKKRFEDIVSPIKTNMINYVNGCLDKYSEKLKEQTGKLQADYKKLKEAKDDSAEKLKKINEFEEKLSELETNIENINKLKEEIKKLC